MTESKLVVRLVEQGLKSTDYAINKHQSTFTDIQKSVVTKIINPEIKGLKIKKIGWKPKYDLFYDLKKFIN